MKFSGKDKIGLIGDVHAEDRLLEAAFAHFKRCGASQVLCVGDIVDGAGDLNRTCDLLRENRVISVRGNHDRWCLADEARSLPMAHDPSLLSEVNKEFLAKLPVTLRFSSPIGGILLCHALAENDMIKIKPDFARYDIDHTTELQELFADPAIACMIAGHSHVPMIRKFDQLTIINPGTLYREHQPGIAMLDLERRAVDFWRFSGTDLAAFRPECDDTLT